MATTTTATALTSTNFVSVPGSSPSYGYETTCPTCGQLPDPGSVHPHHPAELTRRRVKDLEGQVLMLNTQAAQMTEKLADYEDEVQRLRARNSNSNQPARNSLPRNTSFVSAASSSTSAISHMHSNSNPTSTSNTNLVPQSQSPPPQQSQSRLSSLANLLPLRRPSTASQPRPSSSQTTTSSPPHSQSAPPAQSYPEPPRTPTPRPSTSVSTEETAELQNALTREQSLRKAAETQLTQASTELEELTAQLFSQANEMVAQERKARARLEERVAVLERRDVEKRNRLERLEKAMERVERIRALVG
ncbi:uncharacterized protein BDV14DRAFT_167823 [Aspergillus stella-maris]|uniref:uncharacterized protein n=1 Tax=Aspergillus stella-maris TaxID=1810926 RepID=UPI003CCCDDB6